MTSLTSSKGSLQDQIRDAFAKRDLESFRRVLADDVQWGEFNTERGCHNSNQVIATFKRLLDSGVTGEVTEISTGRQGVLCGLKAHFPKGHPREADREIYHVYLVRDSLIYEIQRYDDHQSAVEAAGI